MSIIDKHLDVRAALIAVVDYINGALQTALGSESTRAKAVEDSLQSNINAENKRAVAAEDTLSALYGELAAKFPVAKGSLDSNIQELLSFCETLPMFEFGYSESVTVPAAGTTSVEVTFDKVFNETPQVFTEIMCNTMNNILVSHVMYVDATKATIKLYNGGGSAVSNVTVDYLALAGR